MNPLLDSLCENLSDGWFGYEVVHHGRMIAIHTDAAEIPRRDSIVIP
jgi:hypothetical protein